MKMIYYFLQKHYFKVIVIVALIVYSLQKLEFKIPSIVNNYLNDFLIIPIVLYSCTIIIRFVKSDKTVKLPLLLCIIITIGYGVFFELWIPKINQRYTADILDVLAYFLGLTFFLWLENYTRRCLPSFKMGSTSKL